MNELIPVEHQSQRVLTTQQLAEAYGTDSKTISNNFTRNKERYTEGKHFYRLEGEDLQAFKGVHQFDDNLKFVPVLYLWTEKGAWLHAKSLGTDQAWEAYEMLVDDYYAIQEKQQPLMSLEDLIILQAQSVKELKAKVEVIEENAEFAKEQASLAHKRIDQLDAVDPEGEPRQQLVNLVNKYAHRNGLQYNQAWSDFRHSYNTAFHTNIKLRMKYYVASRGIRKITVPEYLNATGHIKDGIRVANKMLNPARSLQAV